MIKKNNGLKHKRMNNIRMSKTSLPAKFQVLAILFILLNFGTAWGQTDNVYMTSSSGNTSMDCAKSYKLILSNQNGDRTHTFTNTNGVIKTESFKFYGVIREQIVKTRTRTRSFFWSDWSDWSDWDLQSTVYTTDYLTIGSQSYGQETSEYSPVWENISGNTTTETSGGGLSTTQTETQTTIKYSEKEFTIQANIIASSSVRFSFIESTGSNKAKLEAVIKPICCPTNITPANEGIVAANTAPTFNWEDVESATGYTVTITKENGTTTTHTTNISQLTLDDNLTEGNYTWKIIPIVPECTLNCSENSFEVLDIDELECVALNTLTPADNGIIASNRTLSWGTVQYADKYDVYVAPTSVGLGNTVTNHLYHYEVSNTTIQLPIMPEGSYYWTVIPKNSSSGLKANGCRENVFSIEYASAENYEVSPSTEGSEFYFSIMENGYYTVTNNCDGQIHEYKAIIAPRVGCTVYFEYYNRAETDPNRIVSQWAPGGVPTEVDLPLEDVYHPDQGNEANNYYKNRTVRVWTEDETKFSLYVSNEACNSFDASIVLPTHALGNKYMVQTYTSGDYDAKGRPCFMIIATEDNTVVNISGYNSNNLLPSATTVTLHKGQSYFVKSNSDNITDLSGLTIEIAPRDNHPEDACKTFAVFNGNVATGIPTSMSNNRDHLVEQAYPISNWGTEFAITSTDGYISSTNNADVDYIRITAAEATSGTINDGTTTTPFNLATGGTYEYSLHRSKGSCYIKTDKPVACYLYQRSSKQININSSTENDNMGDPSMVWISPIERGIEQITFSTFDATGIETPNHWVNIVIPAEAVDITGVDEYKKVKLGNTDITTAFSTTGTSTGTLNYVNGSNGKYVYARKKIDHGKYTLTSTAGAKMVVHIYGLGNVRGYAYNAGSAAVKYDSDLAIGNGTTDFNLALLPEDHHFCANQDYTFRISTNSNNIDKVELEFEFEDGTKKTEEIENPRNGSTVTCSINKSGNVIIRSYIYSTIFNYQSCQEETILQVVEDYAFLFSGNSEIIEDEVCFGKPYTFKRNYWKMNPTTGELFPAEYSVDVDTYTNAGIKTITLTNAEHGAVSKYGCPIDITVKLTVHPEMDGGTIGQQKIDCEDGEGESNNGENVNLSVIKLTNTVPGSGGSTNYSYRWEKQTFTENDGVIRWGAWSTIQNQNEPTYTVTEVAKYRRVYVTDCGEKYSNEIFVEQAGSFNPGSHIDETIEVCSFDEITQELGGDIDDSDINYDEDNNRYFVVVDNGSTSETIYLSFEWQMAEVAPTPESNWHPIVPAATNYNYLINNRRFSKNTYFRRIMNAVGSSCDLDISMGVFEVKVKPDFEVTPRILSGCKNNDNASIFLDITGGSGNFTVTYNVADGSTSTTPSGTITSGTTNSDESKTYKIFPLDQGETSLVYNYTVADANGCVRNYSGEDAITINNPEDITIGNVEDNYKTKACQGSKIDLPIPPITGGVPPYNVVIKSPGFLPQVGIQATVESSNTTTSVEYTETSSTTPGEKSLIYEVTDANGCWKSTEDGQNVVTILEVPQFELESTPLHSCAIPDATIKVTVNKPGNYSYDIDEGEVEEEGTTDIPYTFTGVAQGEHQITVTNTATNNGCSTTKPYTISSQFVPTVEVYIPELIEYYTNDYVGCPNKQITIKIKSINSTNVENNMTEGQYEYSLSENSGYIDVKTTTPLTMRTHISCNTSIIPIYIRKIGTEGSYQGCTAKIDIRITTQDDGTAPEIEAIPEIKVESYFCNEFKIPDITSIVKHYTSDDCGVDDITFTQSPEADNEYPVETYLTNGISITVRSTNLCNRTTTASIVVKPEPWPNFYIQGDADGENNCYCDGSTIELVAKKMNGETQTNNDFIYNSGESYKWEYKNGGDDEYVDVTDLIGSDHNDYNGRWTVNKHTLTITSADKTVDEGWYRLTITKNGCSRSAEIKICVHPAIEFNLE